MANDEVLGPRKTMLVFVIVVGCFAVLWPRILSPLIVGHTQEQIKPNKFDREAGCCEVIFQSEVAVLELVNEVCNSALGVDKLSPQSAIQCRKAVNETCGLDIAAFLKKNENVGKTTKMLVEAMKNMNSSCLRENFGVPIYSMSGHSPVNSWKLQESLKQERPVRAMGPHPALRERGRAIPPGVPPPSRQQMPPHVRVWSPLSVYFELEVSGHTRERLAEWQPPPIPGMRPPLGSPGGPVTAPKSSMGFVMPIYTICIIVFFVYTLSKILFKRTGGSYEPITPDPQFRRRVFRDESRTSPDKIGDVEIAALRARLEETERAMQRIVGQLAQRDAESQDSQTRPYTNGTILLNTGPVQIVTSEYQEPKEQTPDLGKSKQSLSERKDASPESKHSLHDTQERILVNDQKPIPEETILTKDITESKEQSIQHEINSIKNSSQPNVSSLLQTSIDGNNTSTERREFSPDTNGSLIEQMESSHENTYKDKDLSSEPKEPTPQQKDSFKEQKDIYLEQQKSLEQNKILLDSEEVSIDPKLSPKEPKQTSQEVIENSILQNEPSSESKDMSIEQKESSPDLKETSIQKNSSPQPKSPLEPNESSIQNQSYSDSKESSQLTEQKDIYIEREPFPEPKESSLEKELKELYESSSEEEFIPELLEDKVETEVSLSPEPEACITPDHEFLLKCDDIQSDTTVYSSIPSKEVTYGEDLNNADTKEITPDPNESLSGSIKPAAETDNKKLSGEIDETSVKEECNTDQETLVLENLTKVLDNSDMKQDTIVKSTEEFLHEEREIATKDGPSTPELLAEALKEDSPKEEIDPDNESSTVKVVGMEVTAHPADGSAWPGARPPLAPPKPAPQQHKAEDVKSIFLETEIPQQSRVLVADFEDNANKQKTAKNAPLVVSGKMTLSLIQDAPRDTPERDPESTVDEFTTASATTQPPAEKEDLSDEDLDEEIEVEEIEEEMELESDEEVEPKAVSKGGRK